MAAAPTASAILEQQLRPARTRGRRALSGLARFCARKPLGAFGGLMLVLILAVGAFSPKLAPDEFERIHFSDGLQSPNSTYWFGTDGQGRDIATRVIYGAQVTALVGLGTVALVTVISLLVGVTSGYFGGRTDFAIQRVVDIWLSFPAIFLILTLLAVLNVRPGVSGFFGLGRGSDFGPDPSGGTWFWNTFPRTTIVILALGLVLAGGASRVVRGAVLSARSHTYVEAAVVVGASHLRIINRHILPNIMPTVIVLASLQLGTAILAEATISFLGQGVTNFPTWGQMLAGKARVDAEQHPYVVLFPGMAIFFAVFGFNMLGDALRDVLDPRLRGSR